MAVTKDEIDRFHQFAEERLESSADDLTLETLVDLWRLENPDPETREADVRAIKAAIRDYENGDRGIPLDDFLLEMRKKYNLPADE